MRRYSKAQILEHAIVVIESATKEQQADLAFQILMGDTGSDAAGILADALPDALAMYYREQQAIKARAGLPGGP